MDKMREAIIKFWQDNPVLDLDFRLHTHGQYLTQEKAIVASRAFKAGAAWQAAQSASVPAAELEALRRALMLAIETDGGISYDDEEDFVGERSCCGAISYKPHLPDCWVLQARAAIAGEKP